MSKTSQHFLSILHWIVIIMYLLFEFSIQQANKILTCQFTRSESCFPSKIIFSELLHTTNCFDPEATILFLGVTSVIVLNGNHHPEPVSPLPTMQLWKNFLSSVSSPQNQSYFSNLLISIWTADQCNFLAFYQSVLDWLEGIFFINHRRVQTKHLSCVWPLQK